MLKSLRSRLWLTYALVIGVMLALVGGALVFYLLSNPSTQREDSLRLRSAVALVNPQRLGLGNQRSPDNTRDGLDNFDENFDVRIIVYEPEGTIFYDTRAEEAAAPPELEFPREPGMQPQPQNAPRNGNPNDAPVSIQVFEDQNGTSWLYTYRPMPNDWVVVLAAPRTTASVSDVLADDLFLPLIQAGLVATILALVLAALISRWVAAPLQRMAGAARAVSAGDFQQIELEGPKEVQALGRAFNEMTSQVQAGQQSQRDFVANVSHELKTPLTSVQGFAQAILDGTAGDEATRNQAANIIYDEAGRMHRMVVDLLDLARIDAGTAKFRRGEVDLRALLHAIAEKLKPQSVTGEVMLIANIEPLPRMVGDGDRLAQVFTNLVENAIKHTPNGGTVTLSAQASGEMVEVRVRDTGPGISQEEKDRIFERFYQVDKARKGGAGRGVGLGLAIANEIVQLHQGQLNVESGQGKGSTFIVILPAVRADDTTLAMRAVK